jgi:ABC-type sugar transport system permease subunit
VQRLNMNPYEEEYRRTGKILLVLFVMYVPFAFLVGFGVARLLNSQVAFYGTGAIYLAVTIVVSVKRFVAHYKWTGKFPFYWLFK